MSHSSQKSILIVNGSLGGSSGNTAILIESLLQKLSERNIRSQVLHLADLFKNKQAQEDDLHLFSEQLSQAQAVIFATGTYWDSWGSPLQQFLEMITPLENQQIVLGKPVMTIVTMHSVGGKGVLSRLQGVLNSFGFYQPPLCGFCYSLVNHLLKNNEVEHEFIEDLWSLEDLEIMVENLIRAIDHQVEYRAWPVDRKNPRRIWWK